MPWEIRQGTSQCSGYGVFKQGTSQLEGCHATKEAAQRQMAALYASENKSFRGELTIKNSPIRVGSMVSWNSSGGKATGKVKRIIYSGTYKVPASNFTISATKDNPAVIIEIYRNGKPTGRMVGHRMETLNAKKNTVSPWTGSFTDFGSRNV